MTPAAIPLTRDLVLVGGGHAHALVLRRWGMRPLPGVRLTLIDPNPAAPYSGMLPGHVAGHYPREALDIDLVRLARFAGARLILGRASGIDRVARQVHLDGRGPVAYDILSLDIGITSDLPALPGFAEHAVPAKPLGPFAERWQGFVRAGGGPVVIIGAGVAGVELSLAMAHRLRGAGIDTPSVTVVEAAHALSDMGPRARTVLLQQARDHGITLREGAAIARIEAGSVALEDGQRLDFGLCVGAAGARGQPWLSGTGLELVDGHVAVDPFLRSISDPAIYAVGDCAHMVENPRPKAGVYAVRQAPYLAHNLRADLAGLQRRRYRPQARYLKLISLGRRLALAERGPLALAAPALWRLKDRIDQAFMDKFRDLPRMTPSPPPPTVAQGMRAELAGDRPLCGGCGSKVAASILHATLADLPGLERPDVLGGPGDDAAILQMGNARQVISTDHLRRVTEDPAHMARLAAIHALGDIWAMGAAPQAALATIILPPMSATLQARTLAEITQTAGEVFAREGAVLAGGHTTLGAELTIGFTVTGLAETPVTQAGGRPGDALILTKPIGSGTLLAAEMTGDATGADIAALWRAMARSQGDAAAHLAPVAHAMTDVTGFGLAGHLLAICEASGCGAWLDPDAVPLYRGALALSARGVRSTIMPSNRAATSDRIDGLTDAALHDLLFDPQTCGGLLAAVPEDVVPDLLVRINATRIGTLTDGPRRLRLTALPTG